MQKDQFKRIVAEYKGITDLDPKLNMRLGDYFIEGFLHPVLHMADGGVWLGPCGGKSRFYYWNGLTEEILREYLSKQSKRFEKRQKRKNVLTGHIGVVPISTERTFYVIAAVAADGHGQRVALYWEDTRSAAKWVDDVDDATHFDTDKAARGAFDRTVAFLDCVKTAYNKVYKKNIEFCILEATATTKFKVMDKF